MDDKKTKKTASIQTFEVFKKIIDLNKIDVNDEHSCMVTLIAIKVLLLKDNVDLKELDKTLNEDKIKDIADELDGFNNALSIVNSLFDGDK